MGVVHLLVDICGNYQKRLLLQQLSMADEIMVRRNMSTILNITRICGGLFIIYLSWYIAIDMYLEDIKPKAIPPTVFVSRLYPTSTQTITEGHMLNHRQLQTEDYKSLAFLENTYALKLLQRDSQMQKSYIPHIFHQHWDFHDIPNTFQLWIKSWIKNHPTWEYWFWTPREVRQLLKKEYPDFLQMYDEYPSILNKSDVMRYFVLYKYGGVYMDLDMESLRPMDNWTYKYPCFASEEPYEHAFLVKHKRHIDVTTSFLACKAKHPFFKLLISQLPKISEIKLTPISTGSDLLQSGYEIFHKMTKEQNVLYKDDHISVINSGYFFPTHNPAYNFTGVCNSHIFRTEYQNWICKYLKKRNFVNEPRTISYGVNHWFYPSKEWKIKTPTRHIRKIVPNVKFPSI